MNFERDNALDVLKGLCISLVVYAHLPMDGAWHDRLHSISGFIYTFHIYIFVLITGFLFARKHAETSIKKVLNRMLKPYFVMAPLNVLMYYVAQRFGIKTTTGSVPNGFFNGLINILAGDGGGALWYLYTFGLLQVIVLSFNRLIYTLPGKEKLLISCMVSAVSVYCLKWLGVSVNLICLSFFYYGIVIGFAYDKVPRHPLFLVLAMIAYIIPANGFMSTPLHVVWVISIVFGTLGVVDLVKCRFVLSPMAFIGRHTLAILVFHPLLTTLLRPLGSVVLCLEGTGVLLSLIMLACNVACCIFLEICMRKLHMHKIIF